MADPGRFQSAADLMKDWRDHVLGGKQPTFYPVGQGPLSRIEIGPKLVTLFGGAPGAGKTAFTMQAVVDALRITPTLRATVCNIEMPPEVLLDRQLSRLSGIDLRTIRYRRMSKVHSERIDEALSTIEDFAERLTFVSPPFTLENAAQAADASESDLLLLDYIQRIAPPGQYRDKRASVDATMSYVREFADAGMAVLIVAAVGRTKDKQGRSSYDGDGLNLASFRESSELEFGADDAFVLVNGKAADEVVLRHLKARHTEARDLKLRFDRACQRFEVPSNEWKPDAGSSSKAAPLTSHRWNASTSTRAAKTDAEVIQ